MSQLLIVVSIIQHVPKRLVPYVDVEVIYFRAGGDVAKVIITSDKAVE